MANHTVQNLKSLSFAFAEISEISEILRIQMDYVTITTPLLGVILYSFGKVHLCTKFDSSSFSHS